MAENRITSIIGKLKKFRDDLDNSTTLDERVASGVRNIAGNVKNTISRHPVTNHPLYGNNVSSGLNTAYNVARRANDSQVVRNFNNTSNRVFNTLGDVTGANKGVPSLINLSLKANPLARKSLSATPQIEQRLKKATGYDTNSTTQDLFNAGRFAASFIGAPKVATSVLGKGGALALGGQLGLGGVINKATGGSFMEGMADTARNLPAMYGVLGMTSPLINKGVSKVVNPNSGKLAKFATNRLATGALNIPEGVIINASTGQGGYTPLDAAIDFGAGALGGSDAPQGMAKGFGKQTTEVGRRPFNIHPEDLGVLDYVNDSLKNKKQSLRGFREASDMIDKLAGKYLTREEIDRAVNIAGHKTQYKNRQRVQMQRLADAINKKVTMPIKADNSYATNLALGITDSNKQLKPSKKYIGMELNPPMALQKTKQQIGAVSEPKKNIRQVWDDFYTQIVNRDAPVEKLVDSIEKGKGISIRPEFNPKFTIKRLLGAGGVAELRHRQELDPILNTLKKFNVDRGDFDAFLKARRDLELSARDIKGSDPEQARQTIESLKTKYDPQILEDTAQKLYTYQDKNLYMLRDSGFISDEALSNIKTANQSYVPFERIMGNELDNYLGLPSNVRQNPGTPLKKIKGSDKQILSPIESIISNTYKVEASVAKNNVAKSIINLRNVSPEYSELFTPAKGGDANTIAVWENGQKTYYKADKEIAEAVKGMNEEQANLIVTILSAPAKLLRQQATGRNVEFMLPNIVRDQLDASINAKYGYTPFVDYFIGLHDLIKFKFGADNTYTEAWIQNGGKMFFENMGGRKELQDQLADAKGRSIMKRLTGWLTGGIDALGELSETPTRVGLYRNAMRKTNNPMIATFESREGTLDFARMGSKMKVMNSLVPFLNVSVQGFDKMLRSIKERPAKSAFLLATYGGLPALSTTLYNITNHREDYEQVPDFEKDGNFIIMTGEYDPQGNPMYIKIPKGHIVSTVANPTTRALEYLSGANPQTFSQFAYSFLSSTLPVVGEGSNLKEVASNTIGGIMPQAFKPLAESVSNYSFYKSRPIVPNYLQNKPTEAQFTDYTPEEYKRIGEALGVSPLKIQNVIEGYLAGGVKQPQNIGSTIQMLGGEREYDPNKVFVGRRFLGSYSGFDTERPDTEGGVDFKALFRPDSVGATESAPQLDEKSVKRADNIAKRWKYDTYLTPEPTEELEYEVYRNEILKDAKAVFKEENIKDQDKVNLLARMGYEPKQIELDIVANSTVSERAIWVRDKLKDMPEDERDEFLINLYNNKTLSDSRIFTDSVAEKLGLEYVYTRARAKGKSKKIKLGSTPTAKAVRFSRVASPSIKLNTSSRKAQMPSIKLAQSPVARGISFGGNRSSNLKSRIARLQKVTG